MTPYVYSALPPGSFTRMIRLLPQIERKAPIECILIDYDLSASESRNHLYEALSYTWGSNDKPQSVVIGDRLLPVTENLHTALSYLRDHQLERTLWVDAVCINQKDDDEKNTHIPLMRAIYAQADRVIVWLGEPDYAGPNALDTIHQLAENKVLLHAATETVDLSEEDHDACMRLIRHDWFRRIWVLQEVGVARSIMFRCGVTQVNGYSFCEGLSRLKLSLLPEHVLPVITLVRGSIVRPRNSRKLPGSLPIGELIDMYHTHFATVPHDKIYALLGLCSDDPETPCLRPDYRLAFSAVVRQIVNYIFMGIHTVAVLPDTNIAVIEGKGWLLGHIVSVKRNERLRDYQTIRISFYENTLGKTVETEWGNEWVIHASAKLIQVYDIVCFLHQASKPTIVRLGKGKISVIVSMATPEMVKKTTEYESFRQHSETKILDIKQQVQPIYAPPIDFVLIWDISSAHRENRSGLSSAKVPMPTMSNSLAHTLLEKERNIRCQQVILESTYINILKLKDPGAQFKALKRVLCRTLVQIPVSERVLEVAAAHAAMGYRLLRVLLDDRREELPITEISVENATDMDRLMYLLFRPTADIFITEHVTNAASSNPKRFEILRVLYQHQKDLPIFENDVQTASTHIQGLSIFRLIYQHQRILPISELTVENAVQHVHGIEILRLFYQHQDNIPISEEAVEHAVCYPTGLEILRLFYQHQDSLPISEYAVETAVPYPDGIEILYLFYQHQGSLPISEDAVETAVHYPDGLEILRLFYQHQDTLPISTKAIEAAIRYNDRLDILRLFCQHQDSLPITEDLLKEVVKLPEGTEVLQLFFEQQSCPRFSPNTIQNASSSPRALRIVHFLQQYYPERSLIPEAVITAAIEYNDGSEFSRQFYQRDKNLPISQEVVDRAIVDPNCFKNLSLLYQTQKNLPINKAAVEYIAMELVLPEYDALLLRLVGKNQRYEYSKKCLELIYQHQRDMVHKLANDSSFKNKITRMLREAYEDDCDRLWWQMKEETELSHEISGGGDDDDDDD